MRRVLLLCLVLVSVSTVSAQDRKRIAVVDFDYATVREPVAAAFGTDVDVGKGIADMLIENFVRSGVYSVVEREALDAIMTEQAFSNSDRADSSSAVALGKLLGVDAIVIGSISEFGRDDTETNTGGGLLGNLTRGIGISRNESKAVVGVTARLVSTETAEVLTVANGEGEAARSGTSIVGTGEISAIYDISSDSFSETILGEAARQAVDSLSRELDSNAGRIPSRAVRIEGLVADVDGNVLTLNVGTNEGVQVGVPLLVERSTREIRDPVTGAVLRRVSEHVGEVVVTEVGDVYSVGTFSGETTPVVGDVVASVP